jgi:protein dithiol oxidoreductase (disulfide-forming)
MQRRDFSRSLMAVGATASVGGLATWSVPASAQIASLKEGVEYVRLPRKAPVDAAAGQIEVVEFFAYSCIHCFHFEPLLVEWIKKKPADVVVHRVPVKFSDAFVPLQKLYYSLEAMGLLDSLHEKVFQAFNVERLRLLDAASITDWVVKQGVDRAKFSAMFNSFGVAGKAKRAAMLQDAFAVEGTPALGVAGQFSVPGQGPRTLQVADVLIAEVRKG